MYIAFKGSYSYKTKHKARTTLSAYPSRYVCLALRPDKITLPKALEDLKYKFLFLSDEELQEKKEQGELWIRLTDIDKMGTKREISGYLKENAITNKEACILIYKLYNVLNTKEIGYEKLEDKTLPEIFYMFDRINTSGTKLSPSDVVFSQFITDWPDSRKEIHDLLKQINDEHKFSFDKDFVLKSCLVLSGLDVKFKAKTFHEYINEIKKNWSGIKEALMISTELTSEAGYTHDNLSSKNALIPISHYIFKADLGNKLLDSSHTDFKTDREKIQLWLRRALITRAFSGQSDEALRIAQKVIKKNSKTSFPLEELAKEFDNINKPIIFSNPTKIEELLQYKKDEKHSFSMLALLYPNLDYKNKFHIDHIFPKSKFTEPNLIKMGISQTNINRYIKEYDCIGNLQLLEGRPNEEKSNLEPEEWLEKAYKKTEEREDYLRKNYLPTDMKLRFKNFLKIIDYRKKKIVDKLSEDLLEN